MPGLRESDAAPPRPHSATPIRRTGLDRAFELLAAAGTGEEYLAGALGRIVEETAHDPAARSALLGSLAHACLVAIGSLAELTGERVEAILPALRSTMEPAPDDELRTADRRPG